MLLLPWIYALIYDDLDGETNHELFIYVSCCDLFPLLLYGEVVA